MTFEMTFSFEAVTMRFSPIFQFRVVLEFFRPDFGRLLNEGYCIGNGTVPLEVVDDVDLATFGKVRSGTTGKCRFVGQVNGCLLRSCMSSKVFS